MLKKNNHIAEYVTETDKVQEKLYSQAYDVVFLDLIMPKISGLELLKEIKQNHGDNVSCVMVTSDASSISVINALNLGADGYIVKPFKLKDIDDILHKILNNKNKQNDAPGNTSTLSEEEKILVETISESGSLLKPKIVDKKIRYEIFKEDLKSLVPKIEALVEKGYLRKKVSNRIIVCPICGSVESYSKYECNHCKSTNVERKNILRHMVCGNIHYERDMGQKQKRVCTICNSEDNDHSNWSNIGTVFSCNSCNSNLKSTPTIIHHCDECKNDYDHNSAHYSEIYAYTLLKR